MLFQFLGGHLGVGTVFGDVRLGKPKKPVEYHLAVIVIAPIHVLVAASKAEAAAAIGAFVGPHGSLRPTLGIEDVL